MNYVDKEGKVRMLIVKRHLFKGIENYFIDSLLYQDSLETDENPYPEEQTQQIQSQKKKNVSRK